MVNSSGYLISLVPNEIPNIDRIKPGTSGSLITVKDNLSQVIISGNHFMIFKSVDQEVEYLISDDLLLQRLAILGYFGARFQQNPDFLLKNKTQFLDTLIEFCQKYVLTLSSFESPENQLKFLQQITQLEQKINLKEKNKFKSN